MYPVSNAYAKAMREPFRQNRSRARVYLGLFDDTADADGNIVAPEAVPYADANTLNTQQKVSVTYATFEPGFFRLDGSPKLLPDTNGALKPQGWISSATADADGVFADPVELVHDFSNKHTMVGITLTFGVLPEEVPASVTLQAYTGAVLSSEKTFTDLTPEYKASFPVTDIDKLVIRFDKAKSPFGRARMNKVEYGIGYVWQDDQLINVSEKHAISPVSMELPTSSLSFTVDNSDGWLNIENDSDVTRFLSEEQDVQVSYGVDIDGVTEWVPGGTWYLTSWSVSGSEAAFTADDLLTRLTTGTYEKGTYMFAPRFVTDIVDEIMEDAGVSKSQYYIGPDVQRQSIYRPVPIKSHAECLQLIANRVEAQLYVDRSGRIVLDKQKTDYIPKLIEPGALTAYSDINSVLQGADDYATFESEYFRLDGTMLLLPDNADTEQVPNSGYTGSVLSNEKGGFPDSASMLVFRYKADTGAKINVPRVTLSFGGQIPRLVWFTAYKDNSWLPAMFFYPKKNTEDFYPFYTDVTQLWIAIQGTRKPNQRGHLSRVYVDQYSGFTLDKDQIIRGGTGSLEPMVRNVTSMYHLTSYHPSFEYEAAQTVVSTNAGPVRIEHDFSVYKPTVKIEDSAGITVTQENYSYVSYVSLQASENKNVDVSIVGDKLWMADYPASYQVNEAGEDLPVESPLYDTPESMSVLKWIGEYYRNRVKRVIKARGFPEVDCGDIILVDGRKAYLVETTLSYNGAFNETFTVREGGA